MGRRKQVSRRKQVPLVIDSGKLQEFENVTKLAYKYWGDTPGMFHKLSDGAWGVNTSGFEVERLGSSLEEIEQYMKAHPRTKESEMQKFEDALLQQLGIRLD